MIYPLKLLYKNAKICFYSFFGSCVYKHKMAIFMLFEYTQHPIFEQYGALNAR